MAEVAEKKRNTGTLKAGISGVRGIWQESLTDADVHRAAWAIGQWIHQNKLPRSITLGGDPRPSTAPIKQILVQNLISAGINIVDVGTAPTPTIQFLTKNLQTGMGIAVTASHNPIEWNGWKLIRSDGLFFFPKEMEEWITQWRHAKSPHSSTEGDIFLRWDAQFQHIEKIMSLVDVAEVRSRHFRVAVDSCNGAGSNLLPRLLYALGCDVILVHCDPTKPFPRNPEPLPENLVDLCAAVQKYNANLGFAQDADADRLAIVNEKGEPIGEELTLAIAVKHILQKSGDPKKQKVVINLSTSQTTEDVARTLGAEVIRTPVGEINVVQEMVAQQSIIGGEGNGGVIYPEVGYARDSLIAAALVLEFLCGTSSSSTLSQMVEGFPRYYGFRKKIPLTSISDIAEILQKAERVLGSEGGQSLDRRDGIWARLPGGWIQVRASNTEPIVRIMGEAKTKEEAERLQKIFSLG